MCGTSIGAQLVEKVHISLVEDMHDWWRRRAFLLCSFSIYFGDCYWKAMSILEAHLAAEAPSPAAVFVPPSSQKLYHHCRLYLRPLLILEPDALGWWGGAKRSLAHRPRASWEGGTAEQRDKWRRCVSLCLWAAWWGGAPLVKEVHIPFLFSLDLSWWAVIGRRCQYFLRV
jgi:hypothetical protein